VVILNPEGGMCVCKAEYQVTCGHFCLGALDELGEILPIS
jgi:hypothetical protein